MNSKIRNVVVVALLSIGMGSVVPAASGVYSPLTSSHGVAIAYPSSGPTVAIAYPSSGPITAIAYPSSGPLGA